VGVLHEAQGFFAHVSLHGNSVLSRTSVKCQARQCGSCSLALFHRRAFGSRKMEQSTPPEVDLSMRVAGGSFCLWLVHDIWHVVEMTLRCRSIFGLSFGQRSAPSLSRLVSIERHWWRTGGPRLHVAEMHVVAAGKGALPAAGCFVLPCA